MLADLERKERVVISCVTFETVRVTDPIRTYEATRAHLIRYVSNRSDSDTYVRFYEKVKDTIGKEGQGKVEVFEHHGKVSDFTNMLRLVLKIIQEEKQRCCGHCDIYVNISAGTPEYSAAAAVASMMEDGVYSFSVNAGKDGFTVPGEAFFIDGEPVGMIKTTRTPVKLPRHPIDIPEKRLVCALRILHDMSFEEKLSGKIRIKKVTAPEMVKELIGKGLWMRRTEYFDEPNDRISELQKRSDAVTYQRDFIDKWKEKGWIEIMDYPKRYVVSELGKTILSTFYVPDDWEPMNVELK